MLALAETLKIVVLSWCARGRCVSCSALCRSKVPMADKLTTQKRLVAYFSMEIALENSMPSYSGGLGVLAGDTIRALMP